MKDLAGTTSLVEIFVETTNGLAIVMLPPSGLSIAGPPVAMNPQHGTHNKLDNTVE